MENSRGSVEVSKRQPSAGSFIRQRLKQKAHERKTEMTSKISWKSTSGYISTVALVADDNEQDKG